MTGTADAGIITDPPILTHETNRSNCGACGSSLDPNVQHRCWGNRPWEPGMGTTHRCPTCWDGTTPCTCGWVK